MRRKHGVSEVTLYTLKTRYGGMDVSEAKRLKQHVDENAKLKKILAEQILDAATLCGLLQGNASVCHKRKSAAQVQAVLAMSKRRACSIINADCMMIRYRSCRTPYVKLMTLLRDLINKRKRFSCRRLFVLLQQDGEPSWTNHIYPVYREEGLTARKRRARRSRDFVRDQLA